MPALLTSAAWIALHFILFVALVRHLRVVRSEKGILLYHILSCACVGLGVVAWGVVTGSEAMLSALLAAAGLHGMYSMSFLAMWSSAEGGFSLRMMKALEHGPRTRQDVMAEFVSLGDSKRSTRLAVLERAGWIRQQDGLYRPTGAGLLLASVMRIMHRVNDFESTG